MRRPSPALAGVLLCAPGWLSAQRVQRTTPLNELTARVARDSNDAPAHYEAALGNWVHKQCEAAERHLRAAILIEPKTATAYLAPALLQEALIVDANPDDPSPLADLEEARAAWTRFLALAPSRGEAQRQEVQQQLATLN